VGFLSRPGAGCLGGSEHSVAGETIYSVFLSSTYDDLREERAAVQKALLQLHCMPITMELFGSADEDTWEFIKRQIEDCDYYVVIVADRYGSTDEDGISYTEKEYDYARQVNKRVLAFVHENRENIPRIKTETDPEKRSRLEAFIQKVSRSPVSFFNEPNDLATQVTVSFVNLRERHPAVGFIRADRAPDLKRHAELLEENSRLRDEIAKLSSPTLVPFENASDKITLVVEAGNVGKDDKFISKKVHKRSLSLGELFSMVGWVILSGFHEEKALFESLRKIVYGGVTAYDLRWAGRSPNHTQILFLLFGKGLIDVDHTLVENEIPTGFENLQGGATRKVRTQHAFWKLTDYGKKQFGLFMPVPDTNPSTDQTEAKGLPAATGARPRSSRRRATRSA
jgi:hypothetical protein